jgi:hypothetical protein
VTFLSPILFQYSHIPSFLFEGCNPVTKQREYLYALRFYGV